MILSHTNPDYPLAKHLEHTRNIALEIMPRTAATRKYKLEELLRIATETHDLGKATVWFQKYLKGEYNGHLKDHALISACFAHYVAEKKKQLDRWQRAAVFFAVLGHHGRLRETKPNKDDDLFNMLKQQAENIEKVGISFLDAARNNILDTYKYIFEFLETVKSNPEQIIKNIRTDIRKLQVEAKRTDLYENVERFLITKMLYSLLVSADTMSAALRTDEVDEMLRIAPPTPERIDKFVEGLPKSRTIDIVRSKIFEMARGVEIKKGVYILELPTGAGKTFTGMRLATTAKRPVIYTLPYTSIIDQTVNILGRNDLYDGDVLPYHHLSKYDSFEDKRSKNYEKYQQKVLEMVTENWFYPVVVTTYEQVMYALVWNQKRFSQRMHAISRNAIILDEIQSVPARIWDATWYVLRAVSELFEIPILVMSATVPKIPNHAANVVQRLQIHPSTEDKQVFIRRTFKYAPKINSTEQVARKVVELAKQHDKVLCVVNTRCDAYKIYENVKKEICDTGKEVILLSAHIPPNERLKRIKCIKECLKRWVVISTQVVEAGVDIDADVLVRDIAPLDSIVQSAGRCNRNGERERGQVIITEIKDTSGRLRAYTIYNQTIVNITREILKNMPENADDAWIEEQMEKFYESVLDKTRKEEDMGYEGIPVLMGKMRFDEVRENFALIQEIPAYTVIIADEGVQRLLNKLEQIKQLMREADTYEERITLVKNARSIRTKLERHAVAIYKPSRGEGKAAQMLQCLKNSTRDALKPGPFEDSFVLILDALNKELRKKTEEVGISWICEAEEEDCLESRFV